MSQRELHPHSLEVGEVRECNRGLAGMSTAAEMYPGVACKNHSNDFDSSPETNIAKIPMIEGCEILNINVYIINQQP
jgi:hypothetical protein